MNDTLASVYAWFGTIVPWIVANPAIAGTIGAVAAVLTALPISYGAFITGRSAAHARHQQLRNDYTSQISNVHDAYVNDWKEKKFVRKVAVSVYVRPDGSRYARDMGQPGNPGDPKSNDGEYDTRMDVRNLVRRHLRFNYIESGDDYEQRKRALLEFWERAKKELTWEKTACYNLTGSLQDLGILVRTGALPASYVFMSAGRHVIEEWVYGMETVYGDFRKPAHNVAVPGADGLPELGAMRRHAEWLACACAIYWHNHYTDGYLNFFIAEMDRACKGRNQRLCKAKTPGLYNLGDKIDLRLPLDIQCLKDRERALFPLDAHLLHRRIADSINADINDILYPTNPKRRRHGVNASRQPRFFAHVPKPMKQATAARKRHAREITLGKIIHPFKPRAGRPARGQDKEAS